MAPSKPEALTNMARSHPAGSPPSFNSPPSGQIYDTSQKFQKTRKSRPSLFELQEQEDTDEKWERLNRERNPYQSSRRAQCAVEGEDDAVVMNQKLAETMDRQQTFLFRVLENFREEYTTAIERLPEQLVKKEELEASERRLMAAIERRNSADDNRQGTNVFSSTYQIPAKRAYDEPRKTTAAFIDQSDLRPTTEGVPIESDDDQGFNQRPYRGNRAGSLARGRSMSRHRWEAPDRRTPRAQQPVSPPSPPPKPPRLQSEALTAHTNSNGDTFFRAQEIGYFHPGLPVTKEQPEGPYTTSGKEIYYRDVHMFVTQVKRVGRKKDIAPHLHLCLRGSAMTWFSSMKVSLQDAMSEDLYLFCDRLVDKYKLSHSKAFDLLTAEKYTMPDAQRLRPADEYVQAMLLYGQSCGQSAEAVLTLAWKNLDRELQRDVQRPNDDPDEFVRQLDSAAEYWASRNFSSARPNASYTKPEHRDVYPNKLYSNPAEEKEAAFQRGVRSTERRLLGGAANQQQARPNQ